MKKESGSPNLFAEALLGSATPAEFLGNVLQSSTEYSVLVKDLDGRILLWNRGAERLYRYEAKEVIGKSSDLLHAPEDIALGLPLQMREMALKEGKWEGVISRITKDQLRLSCRVVLTPYLNVLGHVKGFLLISKDVSSEYRIREKISKSRFIDVDALGSSPEDLLEFIITLIQASTEYSIVGTGANGKVVLWSEGARRIYGYEPADLVGKANIAVLHTDADRQKGLHNTILGTALQSGLWEGEVQRARKDRSEFVARVTVTPRFDSAHHLLGFLMISRPIG